MTLTADDQQTTLASVGAAMNVPPIARRIVPERHVTRTRLRSA
jgi:hypothetical protein